MGQFSVCYRIFAQTEAEAQARAEGIAVEQTVEIPRDIVPEGYIEDSILGHVTDLSPEGPDRFVANIRYHSDAVGGDLPQMLNVIFGNSSIQKGIKVIGLDVMDMPEIRGANFGVSGVRDLCETPEGPLIAPVLKPMGTSADDLAQLAYDCALGGAQIIKEDHGLANQPAAPFQERVEKIAQAVAQANRETGRKSLYFPCLSGSSLDIFMRAQFARDAGADGLLVMPGLHGYDLAWQLSRQPDPLPIMAHPSFLGPYVLSPDTGFSHGMMFGTLPRLAGVDISVFPNVGGRFGFSLAECQEIVSACRADGVGPAIWPSPGGGMSPERAPEMVDAYGVDTMFLLGGSLLRQRDEIGAVISAMQASIKRASMNPTA